MAGDSLGMPVQVQATGKTPVLDQAAGKVTMAGNTMRWDMIMATTVVVEVLREEVDTMAAVVFIMEMAIEGLEATTMATLLLSMASSIRVQVTRSMTI